MATTTGEMMREEAIQRAIDALVATGLADEVPAVAVGVIVNAVLDNSDIPR